MKNKKLFPILLLLLLVVSFVACKSDETEQNVIVPVGEQVAPAADDNDVEPHEVEDADGSDAAGQSHDDDSRPAEAALPPDVPPFVPTEPASLDLSPEALAFSMGDPDAPVQLIEFTDYQCPYCKLHATETMPDLLEKLVDSGRVFYGIKDLPLDSIHPDARMAGVAARCAGEQEAYLLMHDAIFAAQDELHAADKEAQTIFTDLAGGLDLEVEAFESCLVDSQQMEKVQDNQEEAYTFGVGSTPFFFVNGYAMVGAQPYEAFEMAVDLAENNELAAAVEDQARQMYDAALAAEAARCARAQDESAFVAMHDLLFEEQGSWSGQVDAAELFTGFADEIGLDVEHFDSCLENRDFETAVLADMQEAIELGFTGTPAFLINGQPMFGAQPYELFKQAVESSIAQASVPGAKVN